MRNGFLMVLLVFCAGCQSNQYDQFRPTDCRWGSASDKEVEEAKAAYREHQALWEKALKGPENSN